MEICQDADFELKLYQLVKQFAPYQKVTLIYDFTLSFELLTKIEKILAKNCILTKFIYADNMDYEMLTNNLQDATRMLILACESNNVLHLKSNFANSNIPLVQIQTTHDLIGLFLTENSEVSTLQNQYILLTRTDCFHNEQQDFIASLSSISCLLSHAIYSKIEAYTRCNSEQCTIAQNNLEMLLKNVESLFQILDIREQNEKAVAIQIEYLSNIKNDICFHDKKISQTYNYEFSNVVNICYVNMLASLFVMQMFNQNNFQIADTFKIANKNNKNFYIENATKFYNLIFCSNYIATLKEYFLSFAFDIQRVLNELKYIKKYINVKKNQKNDEKNAKNEHFLLKNIKKFEINNFEPNYFSIPLLLNLYEKIDD